MKNLKLRSILFSLMAVVMVTVFLSSCTETDLPEPAEDNVQISAPKQLKIFLPKHIDGENENEVHEFIDNASPNELKQYEKDAIIYEHLKSLNKSDEVLNDYGKSFESYSNVELSNYISDNEIEKLDKKLQKMNEIQSRGGCIYSEVCYYYNAICCSGSYCWYCTIEDCYWSLVCW